MTARLGVVAAALLTIVITGCASPSDPSQVPARTEAVVASALPVTPVVTDVLSEPAGIPSEALATPTPSLTPSPSPATTSGVAAIAAAPTKTSAPAAPTRISVSAVRAASRDEERLRGDGCLAFERVTAPRRCTYGKTNGDYVVALVGDSHAAHWFGALEKIAKARGWKLVTYVKVSCPFLDMRVRNLALGREYRECATWNANVIARLKAQKPDLTLIGMSRNAIHVVRAADKSTARKGAALARFIEKLPGRTAIIVDVPFPGRDIPACLRSHRTNIKACAFTKRTTLSNAEGAIERAAVKATGAGLIDMTTAICPSYPCAAVTPAGIVKFRDEAHLTLTFARSLREAFATALDEAR